MAGAPSPLRSPQRQRGPEFHRAERCGWSRWLGTLGGKAVQYIILYVQLLSAIPITCSLFGTSWHQLPAWACDRKGAFRFTSLTCICSKRLIATRPWPWLSASLSTLQLEAPLEAPLEALRPPLPPLAQPQWLPVRPTRTPGCRSPVGTANNHCSPQQEHLKKHLETS